MILDASVAGSRLTNLLPVHSRSWWPMVEDIFSSRVCQRLDHQLLLECVKHDEFTYLSVDGTVKCTMPLLGQIKPGGKNRQSEPFFINAADAIHTVVTVRGRSGAVVGFWPLISEKAEHLQEAFLRNLPQAALDQVQCVAKDAPSSLMFSLLRSIMPNLQCLCLDPVHLAIKYEYATGRRRTKGSASLRACLGKFNSSDSTATAERWGAFSRASTQHHCLRGKQPCPQEACLRAKLPPSYSRPKLKWSGQAAPSLLRPWLQFPRSFATRLSERERRRASLCFNTWLTPPKRRDSNGC